MELIILGVIALAAITAGVFHARSVRAQQQEFAKALNTAYQSRQSETSDLTDRLMEMVNVHHLSSLKMQELQQAALEEQGNTPMKLHMSEEEIDEAYNDDFLQQTIVHSESAEEINQALADAGIGGL